MRSIAQTKDGRYVMPRMDARTRNVFDGVLALLRKYGAEDDLNDEKYQDGGVPGAARSLRARKTTWRTG